jgi:hypothetical protein
VVASVQVLRTLLSSTTRVSLDVTRWALACLSVLASVYALVTAGQAASGPSRGPRLQCPFWAR